MAINVAKQWSLLLQHASLGMLHNQFTQLTNQSAFVTDYSRVIVILM